MTTRKITPIPTRRAVTYDPARRPIDALHEQLARARATLDLLYCLTLDSTGEALEAVDRVTLPSALSSAIEQIDAAVKIAEALNADQVTAAAGGAS